MKCIKWDKNIIYTRAGQYADLKESVRGPP